MTQHFSHLVWLGAGTATEPAGLLNLAAQTTLFEAREAACQLLQKNYPQKNIAIKQLALTTDGITVEFTEYNLNEFSAAQPATGLKKLFPGLKAVSSEKINSTSITEAVGALALTDNHNLLVVDIASHNLALLKALEHKQLLNRFDCIHIQAGNEPLYQNAATAREVTDYLEAQGYIVQHTANSDPDFPWLTFSLNPLWKVLQQSQLDNNQLKNTLEKIKQELAASQEELANKTQETSALKADATNTQIILDQQLSEHNKILSELKQIIEKNQEDKLQLLLQLDEKELKIQMLQQQLNEQVATNISSAEETRNLMQKQALETASNISAKNQEAILLKQELDHIQMQHSNLQLQHQESKYENEQLNNKVIQLQLELNANLQQLSNTENNQKKLIEKLQTDIQQIEKQYASRLEKISILEKNNRALHEANEELNKKEINLKEEMLKAEAQIEIIKELLLTN